MAIDPFEEHICAICWEQDRSRTCVRLPFSEKLLRPLILNKPLNTAARDFLRPLSLHVEADGSTTVTMCVRCNRALQGGTMPGEAVANNNAVGALDLESPTLKLMARLTDDEVQAIALVRPIMLIRQHRPWYAADPQHASHSTGQFCSEGSVHCVENNVLEIAWRLPRTPAEVGTVHIVHPCYNSDGTVNPRRRDTLHMRAQLGREALDNLFQENSLHRAHLEAKNTVYDPDIFASWDDSSCVPVIEAEDELVPVAGSNPQPDTSDLAAGLADRSAGFVEDEIMLDLGPAPTLDNLRTDVSHLVDNLHAASGGTIPVRLQQCALDCVLHRFTTTIRFRSILKHSMRGYSCTPFGAGAVIHT